MADTLDFVSPNLRMHFWVPLGVVATGFVLFTMGAVMGIGSGTADFDVVAAMKELGFGWWGFLVLWLAQWTSQLVNVYSLILSLCNMFDMNTERQEKAVDNSRVNSGISIGIRWYLKPVSKLLVLYCTSFSSYRFHYGCGLFYFT